MECWVLLEPCSWTTHREMNRRRLDRHQGSFSKTRRYPTLISKRSRMACMRALVCSAKGTAFLNTSVGAEAKCCCCFRCTGDIHAFGCISGWGRGADVTGSGGGREPVLKTVQLQTAQMMPKTYPLSRQESLCACGRLYFCLRIPQRRMLPHQGATTPLKAVNRYKPLSGCNRRPTRVS